MADDNCQAFIGEYDDEGVYVYQAFKKEIGEYAVENQTFIGSDFKTERMTWIKPSFGWMLYRSRYGTKAGQTHILKIKISQRPLVTKFTFHFNSAGLYVIKLIV